MVAYSFKAAFVPAITARTKRQAIRLPRARHAQPGERVQLYSGMRTRSCARIIPDPVCIGLDRVVIDTRQTVHVEVNGIVLSPGEEMDAFARADGFGDALGTDACPSRIFARWWSMTHGRALHEDLVLIRWEDRP